MNEPRQCPDCGTTLGADVEGNCPSCLFGAALLEGASEPAKDTGVAGSRLRASAEFVVREDIGGGGMGIVFAAHDDAIDRSVAVKLIRPEYATRAHATRFLREARILGQLEHPNIVPIHGVGSDAAGRPFYAMKLVKGITLHEVLEKIRLNDAETITRFPLVQLLTVFQKICDAVAFAHARGVIHRDLKPANVMIGAYGEVLVMDWGLAKVVGEAPDTNTEADTPASPRLSAELTMQGSVMGTPTAMAPEQAEGRVADHDERTDIFALGGILYSILTLRTPVTGSSTDEIIENLKRGHIPPPILFNKRRQLLGDEKPVRLAHCPNERVPAPLSAVAMKALTIRPDDRYQSIAELQGEVTAYQNGFATAAEQAGPLKQFALFVRRHKALTVSAAIAIIATTGFMLKIIASERRANHTLAELGKAIPLMRAEVDSLTQQRKFDEALAKLDYLISLAPTNAEFRWLRGNMLQSLLRIDDAATAYRVALLRDRDFVRAKDGLELCERLLRDKTTDGLDDQSVTSVYDLMQRQERFTEANAFLEKYQGSEWKRLIAEWKARIRAAGFTEAAAAMTSVKGRTVKLNISHQVVTNTAFLKGIPVSNLGIEDVRKLTEIEGLRGMPLRYFDLRGDVSVTDWSPLAGMKLTNFWCEAKTMRQVPPFDVSELLEVHAGGSGLEDISRLAGAPLVYLNIGATKVASLAPLRSSKLEWLDISDLRLRDLSLLAHLPLRSLDMHFTSASDLSPLTGLSLTNLVISGTKVSNIAALAGMPLVRFEAQSTPITDLTPLAKSPLEFLNLQTAKVRKLDGLSGTRLRIADLKNTEVSDLRPLSKLPLEELDISNTRVVDVSPLQQPTLKQLRLYGCRIVDFTPLGKLRVERLIATNTPLSDLSQVLQPSLLSLYVGHTRVRDLSALRGKTLRYLDLGNCRQITDWSPLATATITNLNLAGTQISNLASVVTSSLQALDLSGTPVVDLNPLRRSPLRWLNIGNTLVKDVSPLRDCLSLEVIGLPRGITNTAVLRMPNLRKIGFATNANANTFYGEGFATEPGTFWRIQDVQ